MVAAPETQQQQQQEAPATGHAHVQGLKSSFSKENVGKESENEEKGSGKFRCSALSCLVSYQTCSANEGRLWESSRRYKVGWNCFYNISAGQLEGGRNLIERGISELPSHEATEAGAAGGSHIAIKSRCLWKGQEEQGQ